MTATWPKVKLADCVNLLAGFAFKSQHFTDKADDVRLIKGENVSQGRILWDISKRWPAADWPRLEKFQLRPGDVIVAMDRPWVPAGLKWAYIREGDPRALLVQRCARLRSNSGRLDQNFLRFVIGGPGFEDYVRPITTGVNVPHISGQQILDFEFRLPPLPLQRKIADILSAYDELTQNSQRRIAILESMARALYREWFLSENLPPSLSAQVPSQSTLGDLCDLVKEPYSDRVHADRRLLDLSRMPQRSLAPGTTGAASELTTSRILFEPGDTLFGAIRCYLHKVNAAHFSGVTNTSVLVLRPKVEAFRSLVAILTSDIETIRWADTHSTGTKMPVINWGVLKTMPTPLPSQPLAEAFEAVAGPMLDQIGTLAFQVQNLRRTRDLLLPRLLSGRMKVEAA